MATPLSRMPLSASTIGSRCQKPMVKRSRNLRDICTLVVCAVISLTTTSDSPLMLASTSE
ncbi:hypothetical protein D3C75_802600 [compost metagenome]